MPKKRKGKGQDKGKILSSDPVGKFDKSNILPDDYQPKRGRARKRQLEGMTEEEKNAEKKARLLKNQIAAFNYREKKKNHIESLEEYSGNLEKLVENQNVYISEMKRYIVNLRNYIDYLNSKLELQK